MAMAFGQWQRGRAEAAFGKRAPDIPVSPPATGAVIDFIFAIDGMVAALRGIEFPKGRNRHGRFSTGFGRITSDESLGFSDEPIEPTCHPPATSLSRSETDPVRRKSGVI